MAGTSGVGIDGANFCSDNLVLAVDLFFRVAIPDDGVTGRTIRLGGSRGRDFRSGSIIVRVVQSEKPFVESALEADQ